ncbi:hypothetical protein BDN72DRAFT_278712 [Pluteus cervinus]|uniref:Uncharacterized protein n=1 Tax=Pluteus cervinus TaxID=181527 RepID=A0ACD3AER8_9AGAR|nr:hypothetical protein BDN72DRAFT_278712 [Pluteus cervinus]
MRFQWLLSLGPSKFLKRKPSSAEIWPTIGYLNLSPFPLEIWLEILALLPPSSAAALSLTCRSLGWVSQPYIFRHISFKPILVPSKHAQYIDRLNRRLSFFTSPRIAKGIRECTISYARGEKPNAQEVPIEGALGLIVDALSNFPHLRKLILRSLMLEKRQMEIVEGLKLHYLEMQSCQYRGDNEDGDEEMTEDLHWDDSTTTPCSSLRSIICNTERRQDPTSHLILSRVMNPLTLGQLIVGPSNSDFILSTLASSSTPFNNILNLELPIESMLSHHIFSALEHCPSVTRLALRYYDVSPRRRLRSIPSHILPKLHTYDGPHRYATLLAKDRCLEDITLRTFDNFSSMCDPGRLCEILKKLGKDVKTLDLVTVNTLSKELLVTILMCFPELKALSVNAHPRMFPRCLYPEMVERAFEGVHEGGEMVKELASGHDDESETENGGMVGVLLGGAAAITTPVHTEGGGLAPPPSLADPSYTNPSTSSAPVQLPPLYKIIERNPSIPGCHSLTSLTIGMQFQRSSDSSKIEKTVLELIQGMRRACPSLKKVKIWYWKYPKPQWIGWKKVGEDIGHSTSSLPLGSGNSGFDSHTGMMGAGDGHLTTKRHSGSAISDILEGRWRDAWEHVEMRRWQSRKCVGLWKDVDGRMDDSDDISDSGEESGVRIDIGRSMNVNRRLYRDLRRSGGPANRWLRRTLMRREE